MQVNSSIEAMIVMSANPAEVGMSIRVGRVAVSAIGPSQRGPATGTSNNSTRAGKDVQVPR